MNDNFPSAFVIAFLVIAGKISLAEADLLQEKLPGEIIPKTWGAVIAQLEQIIGRELVRDES